MRWRFGDAHDDRALPVDVGDIAGFERAVAALLAAARRHDPERPPDAQGVEDLDVPADEWLAALRLPRRVEELLLFWVSACASAWPADASMLEFLRWISAADHRIWAHLEAAGGVTVTTESGEHEARRAVVTVPPGVLPSSEFIPRLAKPTGKHAGQGVKAWVIAKDVPGDLVAMGHGTPLDFAGAMQTTEDGVLLVCFGPSAADLDVTDDAL